MSLEWLNDRARELIHEGFETKILAADHRFTEGPVWNGAGFYLYSDIPANAIYKMDEAGTRSVYLEQSGTDDPDDPLINKEEPGSNGLAYNGDGHLLLCRHGSHCVARLQDGVLHTVAGRYADRPFNSPNDIVVLGSKTYFSDPPYGLKGKVHNPEVFQPLAGVYCIEGARITLLCDHYQYPNGLALSPDGRLLYISSTKDFERKISVYATSDHSYRGILAAENSDGMSCDRYGNLWLCTGEGLVVLDRGGRRLARIALPAVPSNCCWGGKEGMDLFVTARHYVLLLRGLLQ